MQSIGARFAHGELTLERGGRAGLPRLRLARAAAASSSAPPPRRRSSPRRSGCRCRTRALAPSGQPIWLDMARRSARALVAPAKRAASPPGDILTDAAVRNAMVGPRGLRRLDEPAAAHPGHRLRRRPARGRRSTTGIAVNRRVPRLVDVLPNGPVGHPTVRVFLAGGVPEVMLHLRAARPARRDVPDRRPASRWATCSTGGRAPSGAARLRERLRRRTASIPTTSS